MITEPTLCVTQLTRNAEFETVRVTLDLELHHWTLELDFPLDWVPATSTAELDQSILERTRWLLREALSVHANIGQIGGPIFAYSDMRGYTSFEHVPPEYESKFVRAPIEGENRPVFVPPGAHDTIMATELEDDGNCVMDGHVFLSRVVPRLDDRQIGDVQMVYAVSVFFGEVHRQCSELAIGAVLLHSVIAVKCDQAISWKADAIRQRDALKRRPVQ